MAALYKDNKLPNNLECLGNKIGYKHTVGWFFLKLSECKFCMDSWGGLFMASMYCYYVYDYKFIIWGIMCASINAIFRE
jgi:hypothetical protein